MESKSPKYPYADSRAARMLKERLSVGAAERWMSTRKLAKMLKIKQPSVISHMANGRLAIPVDRAVPLAAALAFDARTFLEAVLEQRFPGVNWSILGKDHDTLTDAQLDWLRPLSGIDAAQLTAEQAQVIGEVARDRNPHERWIEPAEVPYVRRLREAVNKDEFGFTQKEWDNEQAAIERTLG